MNNSFEKCEKSLNTTPQEAAKWLSLFAENPIKRCWGEVEKRIFKALIANENDWMGSTISFPDEEWDVAIFIDTQFTVEKKESWKGEAKGAFFVLSIAPEKEDWDIDEKERLVLAFFKGDQAKFIPPCIDPYNNPFFGKFFKKIGVPNRNLSWQEAYDVLQAVAKENIA